MKINIPDFLLEKEIHLPELVVKGSSIKRILESYSNNFLQENELKMSNIKTIQKNMAEKDEKLSSFKKIIKEDVTPEGEKRQQLMSLTVGVEEAVLKLYKFAVTDQNVDSSLVSVINKLKSHVSEFVNAIDARETKEEEVEDEKIDLNSRGEEDRRDFVESDGDNMVDDDEDLEPINENKNFSLKENKVWKVSIDVSSEIKNLLESYKKTGFKSNKTKGALNILSHSLKSNLDTIKEGIGHKDTALFEEFVDDISASDSEGEFEESYSRMVEWANKGKKLFINID